jgi:alcohol-forming fatty acyl-CoA reductase
MNPMNEVSCREAVRLSLFDFDGTICKSNSWHAFLKCLLYKKNLTSAHIALALTFRRFRLISSSGLKNAALSSMRGWTQSEVKTLGIQIYQKYLRPNLLQPALAELKQCQSEGYRVMIVSGAFDFLLQPFCAEHEIQECLCTRLAYDGGRCLGKLADKEMRGEYKRICLEGYFSNQVVAWNQSKAYSDELNDLPILRLVSNGFIVGSRVPRSTALPNGVTYGPW